MPLTREQKEEIVAKLDSEVFADDNTVVFVNFHKLNVDEANAMRGKLREDGVGYYVAKKSLTGIALERKNYDGERPELDGELALSYPMSEETDATAPARVIYDFQEEYENRVRIVGGIFEGRYLSLEEMTEIAQIPSLETLRGMFANVINSPIQGLAVALNAIAETKDTGN